MNSLSLVTGGAGFIGSHLVEALTAAGRRVRVLDDFSTGQRENLAGITPAPEAIDGSVSDAEAVAHAVQGADVVFHLAARASVQFSVENPLGSHQACATGTLQVLDAARKAGVRRVVYAGSASAYGLPTGDVQTEAEPLRALSPYAAAKLAGEFYCQSFAASYGLETVVLRFFNIFGPRQRADSPYSGVIALFADAMLRGKTPRINGDGLQSRDFTYVGDVVQALMKAANTPGIAGRTYNVGTACGTSVLDLVAALNRLLGTQVEPEHGPARAGDIRHSRADIGAIRRDLGYEPAFTFQEGLRRTLDWYRGQ
jgi:nucleoside-diphosphate-sugar epimerase